MDTRIPHRQSFSREEHSPSRPNSGKRSISIFRWFSNLPISRKTQSITLLIFLSLLGIAVGSARVLEQSLRSQLQNQTKAALAVTELNYKSGIEKMEFGFASLAENPILVAVASQYAAGQPLTASRQSQLKKLLAKETKIHNIEYATLVSKNGKIIVNANPSNRVGERFDPNRLVSEVIKTNAQISSSEVVSWEELKKENASLPDGLTNQDALIRYTVTPIKSPDNGRLIGVLVAGGVVNSDENIVRRTALAYAGEGYSAVYLNRGEGRFSLSTSIEKTDLRQSTRDLPLTDNALLSAAVNGKGKTIPTAERFFRGQIGDRTYTLAARALPNFEGKPVAVLVYGDPETAIGQVIGKSLWIQSILSAIVLCLVPLMAWLIGRAIDRPIERLRLITAEFARGNYQARAQVNSEDEVGQLAHDFNEMADSIENNNQNLIERAEMFRFLSRLSFSESPDESTLHALFKEALEEAQQILEADRLLLYRFSFDGWGYVAYESVLPNLQSVLDKQIEDVAIPETLLNTYHQERLVVIPQEEGADIHPYHLRLLDRLQVKASVIVPIFDREELFGLLIAHPSDPAREWQETDMNFLKQLVTQLQVTLERVHLHALRDLEARLSNHLKDITWSIARSTEETALFEIAVTDSRQTLQVDRVIVYRFDAYCTGIIIAESVDSQFPSALGARIGDPCFAEFYVDKYRQGRVQAIADIHKAGLTDCHLQQLDPFAVKANLVTPILVAGELYGLLIAHQCREIYPWQSAEIDFLALVATQVGIALERAHLLEGQSVAEQQQRQAKEKLQQRAIELLMEIDPLRQGDLSIRATVTEDEIGTIADSYNTTVESLRKIVSRVQSVTDELTHTTRDSGESLHYLARRASQQLEEIRSVMTKIETMGSAIDRVALNAQQAALTVNDTLESVSLSEGWMNRTVDGMSAIQETVAQTTQKIEHLGESSQKISKVVSLIGRFAAQTHLLALKASIEAARAGEEGRGFAVIADEVRSLAHQSASATAEIESLVLDIQNETREVALTMETGTEQVSTGSQLLEETRKGLERITVASFEINELVKAIADSAAYQSQTSQTVHHELLEVSAISELTSSSADQVSTSFESLLQSAHNLSESVAQFKVN